jgi:hypothetical protein
MQQRDVDIVREEVRQTVAYLRAQFPDLQDDERAWMDTLEGETSIVEVANRIVERIGDCETLAEALKERIGGMIIRKGRLESQADGLRGGLVILMGEAGLKKLELAEATVSVRDVKPKLIVTDETLIPEALCKVVRKPDMTAIRAAAEQGNVPGTALDNGRSSVTIRRT